MTSISAYWRLLRFDKPAGILLLWFPTAWALWLANNGAPSWRLILLFFLGTVLMRAAGCAINDIADRRFDKHVTRTKLRPLATGEVSLTEAVCLLGMMLLGALGILIQLPFNCIYWAVLALLITFIYPFCKRFFEAPQIVLGLAFSLGIPMAYTASNVSIDSQALLILLINAVWIVAYDTMYAMTDKKDDIKIGVKSTAILFGDYDVAIVSMLLGLLHASWMVLGLMIKAYYEFYILWFLACGILIYQHYLIASRNESACFRAFLISVYYGFIMWTAVIVGK